MDNTQNTNSSKRIVKNIALVALSNIITLLSGVLVGFLLPKIMTKADYGFYKTFTLYFSYIGLFPLGFIDGIYLVYAGKQYEDLNKEKFRLFTHFLLIFQTIISLTIVSVSLPFLKYEFGIIALFLGINVTINSVLGYLQFISQITGRFKELSSRHVVKAVLTSMSILTLTLLVVLNIVDLISYIVYIAIFTIIQFLITLWYIFTYKDIVFGKSEDFKSNKAEIFSLFKIGLPLLIANLVSSLILSIDRQFVSSLFDIETYASYSFAYNMLSLITTVISAISTVLYPTIKTFNEDQLKDNYNRLISIISIVVAFCVGSYYPFVFIVQTFLPSYVDSLPVFRIILPGLLISSCISIIIFNYYKSLNKQKIYFLISIIVLALSICANFIAYFIFRTTASISIASIIVIAIWFVMVEILLIKRFHINPIKNILYSISIIAVFYLLTYFVNNVFLGFGIYLLSFALLTVFFFFKLIKNKFKSDV